MGELYNVYSGQTPSRSDPTNFKNPVMPWIRTTDLNNMAITKNELGISKEATKKLRVLPEETVLIAMYGGFNQIGRTGMLTYPATINQALSALEPNRKIYPYFLITELNHRVLEWKRLSASSRKDPNITKRDIENFTFQYPSNKEQVEIGNFFKQLNNTIALHQEKLEKLKQLKKGYLQVMFPQKGEKVPQLRFANFYQEWEQHKLGESINFRNGRAYKQEELLDEGKYRVLRVGNFNTNDRWYYSNLELDGNKYASQGDLLYLWATSFGPKIWNEETVIYHYHIWKLEIIDTNIDKQYLYTYLETDKERIQQTTNGTTMFHITKGNMEEREFQYPKEITEQEKIGYIIQQLDNVTNLYYEKLEKIKKLKKFYLQSLFV